MQKLRDYLTREGWKNDWEKIKEGIYEKSANLAIMSTVLGTGELFISMTGNPIYHLAGLASGVLADVIDSASTTPVIRLMNTPEFREYGLDKRCYETNIIVGRHPTMEHYKKRGLIKRLVISTISTALPPTGFGYLAAVPFIVKHNRIVRKKLEEALEAGKTLKKMR